MWVILNKQRHSFGSGAAFMSRGYDFGDVTVVEDGRRFDWLLRMLPDGGQL